MKLRLAFGVNHELLVAKDLEGSCNVFFLCIILVLTCRDSGKLQKYSEQPIGLPRFKLCTSQKLVEYNVEQISFEAHF
jgi:hypothetical protein